MKNILKKNNILLVTFFVVFIVLIGFGIRNDQDTLIKKVEAEDAQKGGGATQGCIGSSGNLYGYIDTENLGPIYLSTESWNKLSGEASTSVSFYVNYDRQNGVWSGRGWNRQVGWVDFSYDQVNDIVRFQTPGENTAFWGGWNGEVDLSKVVYSAQNGSFRGDGYGAHNNTGGVSSDLEDDYIGSGEWTFDGLVFQDPPCPQNVNLFLDGTSYLYKKDCNISAPTIQWITEGVHDCVSVEGLWENRTRSPKNIGTGIKANNDISESNAPVLFKLSCIGNYSGSAVEGVAIASCGGIVPPCEGENCPSEMISPKLIEA